MTALMIKDAIDHAEELQDTSAGPKDLQAEGLTQRDALLEVCDRATIWRSPGGETFASVPVAGHVEHYPLNSRAFRDWQITALARCFTIKGRPASVSEHAVRDARMALEARGHANGIRHDAPLRVAAHGGAIYIDLGTPDWSAVEITRAGRRIVPQPPIPILRTRRTAAFPMPSSPGDFGPLCRMLPELAADDLILFLAYCLSALFPSGPYPVLGLSGEQGSGKSTKARLVQRLTDPITGNLLQPPNDDRDLIAAARHNRVLAFDNLSSISAELSDSLARLATGSEIGGRALFTDHDTATFAACRPVIVNGIPELSSRADLADRSIVLRLDALKGRKTETEWWKEVEATLPAAFGALLGALVVALRRMDTVPTPNTRMADFARLIVAAEPAMPWPPGAFLAAYERNRRHAVVALADGDVVASAIRAFAADQHGAWSGLVSELYETLTGRLTLDARRTKEWPGNARWFSDRMRRAAPTLRALGVGVHERRTGEGVRVMIEHIATPATPDPAASAADTGANAPDAANAPTQPESDAADTAAEFDERAAIVQFDGGLSRIDAEAQALAELCAGPRSMELPNDFGKSGDA